MFALPMEIIDFLLIVVNKNIFQIPNVTGMFVFRGVFEMLMDLKCCSLDLCSFKLNHSP